MLKTLSVRTKIIFTIIVSVLGLSVLVYFIGTGVLMRSYLEIEREAVLENVRRADDAISEFSNQQMIKLSDWAQWDESYEYAITRDQEWIDSTAYPASLANLNINTMMYSDTLGKIFFILATNINERVEVSPQSLREYFSARPALISHEELIDETQGLILLPEGPMVFVSLPLRTSEGFGPISGSISFGRYLDEEKIQDLSEVTHLAISVHQYNASSLAEDIIRAKSILTKEKNEYIVPLSNERIAGYTLLYDIEGAPILVLKVEMPRPIYTQGNITLLGFMGMGVVAFLLFGIMILLLLERLVIARFVRLTSDVEKINDGRDLSVKVHSGEKDEIGRLAEKINQMLTWLREAREAEANSRRETVNLLDDLKKEKEQAEEMAKLLQNRK
jgi:sensor domain CHASE-containing protein